jgi:hypothetical protein
MTKLLEKAFSQASQLPEDEQDLLAKHVLAEIESEHHWDELFEGSQDELARLAAKTLKKHHQEKITS